MTSLATSELLTFAVDPANGTLKATGDKAATSAAPMHVVVHPTGRLAYVGNQTGGDVTVYTLDPATGKATLAGTPVRMIIPNSTLAPILTGIAIHPSGKFLYTVGWGGGWIWGWRIDSLTGTLAALAGFPVALRGDASSLALDPSGKFAFVGDGKNGGEISSYAIDPATGAINATPLASLASFGGPGAIAADPNGKFAFTTNNGATTLASFQVDPVKGLALGTLFNIAPSTGTPNAITVHPNGRWVYTANFSSHEIGVYDVNPTTGVLAQRSSTKGGLGPYGLAVEPSGKFLHAAELTANTAGSYTIDPATGDLTYTGSVPAGSFTSNVAPVP